MLLNSYQVKVDLALNQYLHKSKQYPFCNDIRVSPKVLNSIVYKQINARERSFPSIFYKKSHTIRRELPMQEISLLLTVNLNRSVSSNDGPVFSINKHTVEQNDNHMKGATEKH